MTMNKLYISLFLILCSCSRDSAKESRTPPEELTDFGNTFIDPIDLLSSFYNESQVLFIAQPSHDSVIPYNLIKSLLLNLDTKDVLHRLVLERYAQSSKFYEAISLEEIEEIDTSTLFEGRDQIWRGLCDPFRPLEWQYGLTHFMPEIRKINEMNLETPVIVTTTDSITMEGNRAFSSNIEDVINLAPDQCDLKKLEKYSFGYNHSSTREINTAKIFSEIYRSLLPNQKLIVLYNYGHLAAGTSKCLYTETDSEVNVDVHPSGWIDYFFRDFPEAKEKSKIILIDHPDHRSPDGVLTLVNRYRSYFPNENFAFKTKDANFGSGVIGDTIFQNNSLFRELILPIENEVHLSKLFDGVIADYQSYPSIGSYKSVSDDPINTYPKSCALFEEEN